MLKIGNDDVIRPPDSFVNSQEWTLSRGVPDLRLGIVGSLSSGKSALVHRYLTGSYMQEESPEGGRFKKEIVLDGQSYLLLIRDEGGPPELQALSASPAFPLSILPLLLPLLLCHPPSHPFCFPSCCAILHPTPSTSPPAVSLSLHSIPPAVPLFILHLLPLLLSLSPSYTFCFPCCYPSLHTTPSAFPAAVPLSILPLLLSLLLSLSPYYPFCFPSLHTTPSAFPLSILPLLLSLLLSLSPSYPFCFPSLHPTPSASPPARAPADVGGGEA
ncbi:hypothetical protein Pcinc_041353 [Petrolisthes cinctipes]|uniref:Uncharacterized protein n=1 Tax=Petrolisthes cinctipes TaxID=88211 RepID=A0AAE1EH12_PETCI|nr:hypothetical protein Pcinc_041353 [Petrolisthes cinctipes]